jgi:hypothetical protein
MITNLYTVGKTSRTGDRAVARTLPTHGTTQTQHNAHKHPCLEWDSNPWSHCSSERRQFMHYAARQLWSARMKVTNKWKCAMMFIPSFNGIYLPIKTLGEWYRETDTRVHYETVGSILFGDVYWGWRSVETCPIYVCISSEFWQFIHLRCTVHVILTYLQIEFCPFTKQTSPLFPISSPLPAKNITGSHQIRQLSWLTLPCRFSMAGFRSQRQS